MTNAPNEAASLSIQDEDRAPDADLPPGFDRSSIESARSVIEGLYSERSIRSKCLAQLEDSIRAAHRVNPASWSITLFPDHVRLNVDSIEPFVLQREALYLVVDFEAMDPTERSSWPHLVEGQVTGRRYPSVPTACGVRIPAADLSRRLPPAREPHLRLVRQVAALVQTKGHQHKRHSPAVVAYLGQQLRRETPNPSYYTPSSTGHQEQAVSELRPPRSDHLPPSMVTTALAGAGLSYSPWQIATFYTALQTKGFVILSGISGTGKSKLAQTFANLLPRVPFDGEDSFEGEAEILDNGAAWISEDLTNPGTPVRIKVRGYMLQHKFFVVPKAAYWFFNPPLGGADGGIDVFYGPHQEHCRLRHRFVKGGPQSILELMLRGPLRDWFKSRLDIGDDFVVAPEQSGFRQIGVRLITGDTDPYPGGDSEQSKLAPERIVQMEPEPEATLNDSTRVLFLAVRPDWRDSKSLLGYHNPLTERYEWTPFLRFLLRAKASYEAGDGLVWFLILDEMNLAHVEHYFADLLSVLESGRDEAGWTREPLRLGVSPTLDGLDPTSDPDQPPAELRLPPNLYIVGTVNVDETIHAFSPKVLDRAFTLDLTEVDFTDYPLAPTTAPPPSDDERRALLGQFTRGGDFARIDKREIADYVAAHPEVRDRLQALNALLRPHHLHFGYRVFDEIVAFLANAEQNRLFSGMDDLAPFDAAALMKVLPKFHGSRAKLEAPLRSVLVWCLDPDHPDLGRLASVLDTFGGDGTPTPLAGRFPDARLPKTAERAERMLAALIVDGFAAF